MIMVVTTGWFMLLVIVLVVLGISKAITSARSGAGQSASVSQITGMDWTLWVVRWVVAIALFVVASEFRLGFVNLLLMIFGAMLVYKNVSSLLQAPTVIPPPVPPQPNPQPAPMVMPTVRSSRGFPWGGVFLGLILGGMFFMFMGMPMVRVGFPAESHVIRNQITYGNSVSSVTGKVVSTKTVPMDDMDWSAPEVGNPPPPAPNAPVVPKVPANKSVAKTPQVAKKSLATNSQKSPNGATASQSKPKSKVFTQSNPEFPAGTRIPSTTLDDELLSLRREETSNHMFIIEGDPERMSQPAERNTVFRRAMKVLGNHVHDRIGTDSSEWIEPSMSWLDARNIVKMTATQVDSEGGRRVAYAAVLDVSPQSVEMVYNYHLGCVRTRKLAPMYFGGLLLVGGLGLLLRLGTGVRPSASHARN